MGAEISPKRKVWGCLVIGLGVLVLAHFFPYFFYPKQMKSVDSPKGDFTAEIVVRPQSWPPYFSGWATLLSGGNVDVIARVRNKKTGSLVFYQVLTPMEDMESDAMQSSFEWRTDGSAKLTSRRDESVTFQP